ncbi:hypothetical protein BDDG_00400 [Blastomyces dermatitidis ATCC 18188]|uniref:Uncharacterized protein n=1 Tax=Ajellomyces dermatitidis (strain ATCC 18188 / CBS 674.68) TaxID=653446 RepID=F2T1X9_AJEDA|nr:hypothetical protein BDDG_00400 [Blastomyces dermatitidis ATCC 18188]
MYGFPVDERGCMKLGYRRTKYTHAKYSHYEMNISINQWCPDGASIHMLRRFFDTYMIELREYGIGISGNRLCWYTDSFDNQFVIDHRPGVVVATGGSGHAFKFLPAIGRSVADVVDGNKASQVMLKTWQWRKPDPVQTPVRVLMEGMDSPRPVYKL